MIKGQGETMGMFKTALALLALVTVMGLGACTKSIGEPKEFPQLIGTDAERGNP